jgi:subtilisin-like proprotein convertase family protein
VEGIGNVFFDISNQNFRIQPAPFATFSLENSVDDLTICAGDTATFTVQTQAIAGFEGQVELSAGGGPLGGVVTVNPSTIDAPGTATVRITNITPLMSGTYDLVITGISDTLHHTDTVSLTILPGSPAASAPLAPANGITGLGSAVTLNWEEVNFASAYTVQLSANADFSAPIFNQTLTETTAGVSGLEPGQVYYWHVRTSNACGNAAYSETFSFQVQNLQCNQTFSSADVPQVIDDASVNTALSMLNVPSTAVIGSAQVNLEIAHTWVGDLKAVLSTPWGADIILFDQPGVPGSQYGCGNDDLDLSFSDAGPETANALENLCGSNPALSGTFQPIQPLSVLNGQGATGDWQLAITDNVAEDGGSIDNWSISFCFTAEIPSGAFVHNNTLSVGQGNSALITTAFLQTLASGTAAQLKYTLLALPQHGTLLLNGNPLGGGATFTQADIDANSLTYTHNGDQSLTDNFRFDVYDTQNFAWLHDNLFSIVVVQNNLVATASVSNQVSCNNGSDAVITVDASGLSGSYLYSLNAGTPQTSNVFSGLPAGTYEVVVSGQFGFAATAGPIVIENPSAVTVTTAVTDDQITVNAAGGTAPYAYSLDGQAFQAGAVFPAVPNGIHEVTVQDANGCTTTAQVIVAVNSLLALVEVTHSVSCFGALDGSITATAAGSNPPFEYSLNGEDFQASNVFTGLAAGSYTVIVRDAAAMTVSTNAVEVSEPDLLSATSIVLINDINVLPSGGTPPYSITINGEPSGSFEFQDLEMGEYTFVVTDANGCTATTQATALGNTLVIFFAAAAPVSCAGDQDGVIGLCIDGGIGSLTASISPAAGNFISSSNTSCAFVATYTDLPPGSYTVTITDVAGFSITSGATITEPEPLTLEVSSQGDTIIAVAGGGTFSYEYSLDGVNWQAEQYFPDLQEGIYTVYARDIKLCTYSTQYFLNLTQTIDLADAWGMSVSPNPSTGMFQISLADAPSVLRGDVADITGRVLRHLDFQPGGGIFHTQIDLHELPQGVYVLRLTDGHQTGAVRLSVIR